VQKTAQRTRLGKQKTVFHFRTGPATTAGCSHRRIMADVFGRIDGWWNDLSGQSPEKIPPQVIQREISRALVLNRFSGG
jgi:hypothetical protein